MKWCLVLAGAGVVGSPSPCWGASAGHLVVGPDACELFYGRLFSKQTGCEGGGGNGQKGD